jgi:hypothetical protein
MSSQPTGDPSPSNSSKPTSTRDTPEASQLITSSSSAAPPDFVESPQSSAERPVVTSSSAPAIVIAGTPSHTSTPESTQQPRPLGFSQPAGNDWSSQPLHHQHSARPPASSLSGSEPHANTTTSVMSSSSSSPGNTSTAGTSSGSSNPSYQLPYAPFPYPMPANGRGSGQQQGGQGK